MCVYVSVCVIEDQTVMIIIRIDVCQIIGEMMLSPGLVTLGTANFIGEQCIYLLGSLFEQVFLSLK